MSSKITSLGKIHMELWVKKKSKIKTGEIGSNIVFLAVPFEWTKIYNRRP
jgi:hypothetical protein